MLPPPKLYPVQEVKFERYMPPQVDGREQALAQPRGSTAIVIDNGQTRAPSHHEYSTNKDMVQAPQWSAQDGPSNQPPEYRYLP